MMPSYHSCSRRRCRIVETDGGVGLMLHGSYRHRLYLRRLRSTHTQQSSPRQCVRCSLRASKSMVARGHCGLWLWKRSRMTPGLWAVSLELRGSLLVVQAAPSHRFKLRNRLPARHIVATGQDAGTDLLSSSGQKSVAWIPLKSTHGTTVGRSRGQRRRHLRMLLIGNRQ